MKSLRYAVALAVVLATPVFAQAPAPADPLEGAMNAAHHYFTDIELTDQDGRKHRLYTDLLHGKTVVINAFFASCQGVCPVLSAKMAKIQDYLGEKLGKDVVMLSITVDPKADTPEVLHQYAARWNARPGWLFLTGPPDNVSTALKKLGQYVENKEAHTTIVIVGNDKTGLWKKANGIATPQELVAIVDSVVHDKGE
jgi:protein SCO1